MTEPSTPDRLSHVKRSTSTHHVILAADDLRQAVDVARAVCALVEITGHGACRPTIEVRRIQDQGRLL